MTLPNQKSDILVMEYIGKDRWSRPVYRDQNGHLWKDVNLGMFLPPDLCSASGNMFKGGPDCSIRKEYVIQCNQPEDRRVK